jgi:subtilisin family serine protease
MQKKSSLLVPVLVLVWLMLSFSACYKQKNGPAPIPEGTDIKCEELHDTKGKTRSSVCYRPNEVITNTSEYSEKEEVALFNYLIGKGLTPVDTCKCQQKLIRWGADNRQEIDVIGTVTDAPKNGGPQGDDTGTVAANIFIGIPAFSFKIPNLNPRKDKYGVYRPQTDFIIPNISGSVTVIDTGVDSTGVALEKRISSKRSSVCSDQFMDTHQGLDITDLSNPAPFDRVGHGTHISGIVADVLNPTPSIDIRLRNVKVSEGNTSVIYLFEMLCGMYYALEKGGSSLDVINCSLGWEDVKMPEVMRPLLHDMERMGVLLVAGAGNNGAFECTDSSVLFWPAAFSTAPDPSGRRVVISVGAWNKLTNKLWNKSNQCFDVAAPGVNIPSSFLSTVEGAQAVPTIALCSGTSMAAAHISRVAAEIKANNPGITPAQIKACIIQSAVLQPKGIGPDPSQQVRVLIPNISINCDDKPVE